MFFGFQCVHKEHNKLGPWRLLAIPLYWNISLSKVLFVVQLFSNLCLIITLPWSVFGLEFWKIYDSTKLLFLICPFGEVFQFFFSSKKYKQKMTEMFLLTLFSPVTQNDNSSQINEITNDIMMCPHCFICRPIILQFWRSGCTDMTTHTPLRSAVVTLS